MFNFILDTLILEQISSETEAESVYDIEDDDINIGNNKLFFCNRHTIYLSSF